MTCEDESLISLLLDGEANKEQVLAALALLDEKPELMAFYQRQQWLRAHWQKEYQGEPVDLAEGVWAALDRHPNLDDVSVVDELALRREAKQQTGPLSFESMSLPDSQEALLDVKKSSAVAETAHNPVLSGASAASVVSHKPWWRGIAQGAVAAVVCLAVVGLWYSGGALQPDAAQENLIVSQDQGPRDGAKPILALDVAPLHQEQLQHSAARLVVAGHEPPPAKGSLEAGLLLASDSAENQFVSLEKLRQQERARLATYYMMHTGNSALVQPHQGVQLVRIVDTPLLQYSSYGGTDR